MAWLRRSRTNIRRPPRRRRVSTRRTSVRRRMSAPRRRRRTYKQRAAVNSAPCECPKQLTDGDKFVMIQSDPFDTKYFGAKVPDSSTLPSVAAPVQWNFSLATQSNAADNPSLAHCWAFYPALRNCCITARGVDQTSWNWALSTLADAPQYNNFRNQFEAFRPTAHAIRLSCPFAPTSTTGFVHIAVATETIYTTAGGIQGHYLNLASGIAEMSGYTFYKRVTLASLTQSPITLINKWTDETAFRYQSGFASESTDANGNPLTFHIPYSWGTLLVAVEGASTDTTGGKVLTPLQAEIVVHTECIPDKTNTLLGSVPAASNSTMMSAVSSAVSNTDFAHTEAQQESTIRNYVSEVQASVGERFNRGVAQVLNYAERQGEAVLNRAVSTGLGMAANYLLRPNRGYQNINGPRLNGITNS